MGTSNKQRKNWSHPNLLKGKNKHPIVGIMVSVCYATKNNWTILVLKNWNSLTTKLKIEPP